jgi:hypothetical protein
VAGAYRGGAVMPWHWVSGAVALGEVVVGAE